jgi:hypothetical protein
MVGILPVNTSGWAIAAGYLGLFSLLIVPGPFALATGILAVRHIARNPGMRGKVRAWLGIVLGTLGSVGLIAWIVAILGKEW